MSTLKVSNTAVIVSKDFLMGLLFNFPIFLTGVNYIYLFLLSCILKTCRSPYCTEKLPFFCFFHPDN